MQIVSTDIEFKLHNLMYIQLLTKYNVNKVTVYSYSYSLITGTQLLFFSTPQSEW